MQICGRWLGATYQRRGLRTQLQIHRKLVTVSNGKTITLPSQACGYEQLSSDEVYGQRCPLQCRCSGGTQLSYHHKRVAVSSSRDEAWRYLICVLGGVLRRLCTPLLISSLNTTVSLMGNPMARASLFLLESQSSSGKSPTQSNFHIW